MNQRLPPDAPGTLLANDGKSMTQLAPGMACSAELKSLAAITYLMKRTALASDMMLIMAVIWCCICTVVAEMGNGN